MREVMDVETNIPVPARGEDSEQSSMDESHADDSDLVRSDPEAVIGINIMHVEAPEELIVLCCDASSQTRGCVGCTRLKEDNRKCGNKYITLKEEYDALTKQPAKVSTGMFIHIL